MRQMQCFSLYVKDSIQHEISMSATFKAELKMKHTHETPNENTK